MSIDKGPSGLETQTKQLSAKRGHEEELRFETKLLHFGGKSTGQPVPQAFRSIKPRRFIMKTSLTRRNTITAVPAIRRGRRWRIISPSWREAYAVLLMLPEWRDLQLVHALSSGIT